MWSYGSYDIISPPSFSGNLGEHTVCYDFTHEMPCDFRGSHPPFWKISSVGRKMYSKSLIGKKKKKCPLVSFVPRIVPRMMTSSNGNIFRATGHFCGEFTGHRQNRGAYQLTLKQGVASLQFAKRVNNPKHEYPSTFRDILWREAILIESPEYNLVEIMARTGLHLRNVFFSKRGNRYGHRFNQWNSGRVGGFMWGI